MKRKVASTLQGMESRGCRIESCRAMNIFSIYDLCLSLITILDHIGNKYNSSAKQ